MPATWIKTRRPSFCPRTARTTTLRISQTERPTAKLLAENAILFPEIVDQILLVTIQPAGDGEDEKV